MSQGPSFSSKLAERLAQGQSPPGSLLTHGTFSAVHHCPAPRPLPSGRSLAPSSFPLPCPSPPQPRPWPVPHSLPCFRRRRGLPRWDVAQPISGRRQPWRGAWSETVSWRASWRRGLAGTRDRHGVLRGQERGEGRAPVRWAVPGQARGFGRLSAGPREPSGFLIQVHGWWLPPFLTKFTPARSTQPMTGITAASSQEPP